MRRHSRERRNTISIACPILISAAILEPPTHYGHSYFGAVVTIHEEWMHARVAVAASLCGALGGENGYCLGRMDTATRQQTSG
jgi:hypothetical protein